jgi:hypothetical protein
MASAPLIPSFEALIFPLGIKISKFLLLGEILNAINKLAVILSAIDTKCCN